MFTLQYYKNGLRCKTIWPGQIGNLETLRNLDSSVHHKQPSFTARSQLAACRRAHYHSFVIAETIPALHTLSADQKIILAAQLWRDAVGEAGPDPNIELVEALRERLEYHRQHPEEVSSWEAVCARISAKKNS